MSSFLHLFALFWQFLALNCQNCIFGLYKETSTVPLNLGWSVLDIDTLNSLKSQFIASYNSNNGINAVQTGWTVSGCGICMGAAGRLLTNGIVMVPSTSGSTTCLRTYTTSLYKVWNWPNGDVIDYFESSDIFTIGTPDGNACGNGYKNGLYYKCYNTSTQTPAPVIAPTISSSRQNCSFGIYQDSGTLPLSLGWSILDIDTLNSLKFEFIQSYNLNSGIDAIRTGWTVTGCGVCMATAGRLLTNGVVMVPSTGGSRTCAKSYSASLFKFWNFPSGNVIDYFEFSDVFTIGTPDSTACGNIYRNGLYYKCYDTNTPAPTLISLSPTVGPTSVSTTPPTFSPRQNCSFGIYQDSGTLPLSLGWSILDLDTLNSLKSEFVESYNSNNGIDVIKVGWTVSGCGICMATAGRLLTNGIVMVPSTGGSTTCAKSYSASLYKFWNWPSGDVIDTLQLTDVFTIGTPDSTACGNIYRNGLYYKCFETNTQNPTSLSSTPTQTPSKVPTPSPTIIETPHCIISNKYTTCVFNETFNMDEGNLICNIYASSDLSTLNNESDVAHVISIFNESSKAMKLDNDQSYICMVSANSGTNTGDCSHIRIGTSGNTFEINENNNCYNYKSNCSICEPAPTLSPTNVPSQLPSISPSKLPSSSPSYFPSSIPTTAPSQFPSEPPTSSPIPLEESPYVTMTDNFCVLAQQADNSFSHSWVDAYSQCSDYCSSSLAIVDSQELNDEILDSQILTSSQTSRCWIGFNQYFRDEYQWNNLSSLIVSTDYTNFLSDETNDCTTIRTKRFGGRDLGWKTYSCQDVFLNCFICNRNNSKNVTIFYQIEFTFTQNEFNSEVTVTRNYFKSLLMANYENYFTKIVEDLEDSMQYFEGEISFATLASQRRILNEQNSNQSDQVHLLLAFNNAETPMQLYNSYYYTLNNETYLNYSKINETIADFEEITNVVIQNVSNTFANENISDINIDSSSFEIELTQEIIDNNSTESTVKSKNKKSDSSEIIVIVIVITVIMIICLVSGFIWWKRDSLPCEKCNHKNADERMSTDITQKELESQQKTNQVNTEMIFLEEGGTGETQNFE